MLQLIVSYKKCYNVFILQILISLLDVNTIKKNGCYSGRWTGVFNLVNVYVVYFCYYVLVAFINVTIHYVNILVFSFS